MAKYKVEITGVDTNKLVVLSANEQLELFKKYKSTNDEEAKQLLILGNLKLVLSVLRRFNYQNVNLDDLFQIGVIGLIKAIENFDLSYNLKLSTYAIPLISGEVKRYLRDNQSSLRISRTIRDLSYLILKYKEEYHQKYGHEPSSKEISEALNLSEYQISQALDSLKDPVSIFEPMFNDGGDTIYVLDQIADKKENANDKDLYLSLKKALVKLKKREQEILVSRYIVGKTQVELAKMYNISQAQVSRIEKSAINNMRRLMK